MPKPSCGHCASGVRATDEPGDIIQSSASLAASLVFFAIAILALNAQDFSEIKVEKVGQGLFFTEGPAWSPEGFLLFSDTVTNKLHKFLPGKGIVEAGRHFRRPYRQCL